jgi:hypothetical protein
MNSKTTMINHVFRTTDAYYVITGGHSYLANIAKCRCHPLPRLAAVRSLKRYFSDHHMDWNVLVKDDTDFHVLLRDFQNALGGQRPKITRNDKMRSAAFFDDNHNRIINIINGPASVKCGVVTILDGIRYEGVCDVLAHMKRSLASETFQKRTVLLVLLHAVLKANSKRSMADTPFTLRLRDELAQVLKYEKAGDPQLKALCDKVDTAWK